MTANKRQHFVPQSYLEAWCDKETPARQEPYVWRFQKEGGEGARKAPKNIYFEKEMYTILEKGVRNVTLENQLGELESRFAVLRKDKISKREPLTAQDHAFLCAFVAAMDCRTLSRREHEREQWGRVLEQGERLREKMRNLSEEARKEQIQRARIQPKGIQIDNDQIRRLASEPLQELLAPATNSLARSLSDLDFMIAETCSEPGFITSDHPCAWHDFEAYKRPPFLQSPALCYPSTQIILPISPTQILIFRRGLGIFRNCYVPISEPFVDNLNRIIRFACHESFIVNSNQTKDIWFDKGIEPDDSWNNANPEASL